MQFTPDEADAEHLRKSYVTNGGTSGTVVIGPGFSLIGQFRYTIRGRRLAGLVRDNRCPNTHGFSDVFMSEWVKRFGKLVDERGAEMAVYEVEDECDE